MIVDREKRLVIVTPPKTGSTSLHIALYEQGPCRSVEDQDRWQHTARLTPEWNTFRVAVVVRNPYDRLVSLYHHFARWRASQGLDRCDFPAFVQGVVEQQPGLWLYRETIFESLTALGERKISHVVRFENLIEDMHRLGYALSNFPWKKRSDRRPWREYYTPERMALVYAWAWADFHLFDYDPQL